MTCDEFNQKWAGRLDPGFNGLMIGDEKIVELVTAVFSRWSVEYPEFTYSQIKLKFGSSRVYCDNVPFSETNKLEQEINKLL